MQKPNGKFLIRMVIANTNVEHRHVEEAWKLVLKLVMVSNRERNRYRLLRDFQAGIVFHRVIIIPEFAGSQGYV